MKSNQQSLITAHNIELSLQASWLIQQGMFDADGGRFSGLLSLYKSAIDGFSCKVSYVLLPEKGIAILADGHFNLYVHRKFRKQGIAEELTEIFIREFPHLLGDESIKTQEPTTHILNKQLSKQLC